MTDPGDRRPPLLDLVLLGVAIAAVSTAAPLIRVTHAPTLAVAFWRTALAVPVTGTLLLVGRRGELRALPRTARRQSVVAGLFLAGHFATWVPSLSFTSVASSVALVSTMPVWTAVLARWRGDPVAASTWRGITLALGGVVMLTGVDLSISSRALFGDLLALLGGILAALYLDAGADVRRQASTAVYTTVCYSTAAVALLVVCAVGRQAVAGYGATTWVALLAMTAGPQLLGHTLVNKVVRTIGATVVSVAILAEIVGSAVLAWIFFGEVPPAAALPAAVLLVAGLVVVVRGTSTPAEVASPP